MSDKKYQSLDYFIAECTSKGTYSELDLLQTSETPEWKANTINNTTIDEFVRFQQAQVWKALDEGYYDFSFSQLSDAIKGYEEANALNDSNRVSFALIELGAAIAQMKVSYKDTLYKEMKESKEALKKAEENCAKAARRLPLEEIAIQKRICKQEAQKIATELWGIPEHSNKRVGEMTQEVISKFYTKYPTADHFDDQTFRSWIKKVAPAHAMKRGRPSKK